MPPCPSVKGRPYRSQSVGNCTILWLDSNIVFELLSVLLFINCKKLEKGLRNLYVLVFMILGRRQEDKRFRSAGSKYF